MVSDAKQIAVKVVGKCLRPLLLPAMFIGSLTMLAWPSFSQDTDKLTLRGDEISQGNFIECKSEELIKGLECNDDNCDQFQILCQVYSKKPDVTRKSRNLGTEFTNTGFVKGIQHNNDSFNLQFLESKIIVNRGKDECRWDSHNAKADLRIECKEDELASGFKCGENGCATIQIYCCKSTNLAGSEQVDAAAE